MDGVGLEVIDEELAIMCAYNIEMSHAINDVFTRYYKSVRLRFCQASVRNLIIDNFPNDETDKATEE